MAVRPIPGGPSQNYENQPDPYEEYRQKLVRRPNRGKRFRRKSGVLTTEEISEKLRINR